MTSVLQIALLTVPFLIAVLLALAPWHHHRDFVLLPLKRQREKRVRSFISEALDDQLRYEAEHGARQAERLQQVGGSRRFARTPGAISMRDHGHYDPDQRALSIVLRVRAAYRAAHRRPPKNLQQLVAEALK